MIQPGVGQCLPGVASCQAQHSTALAQTRHRGRTQMAGQPVQRKTCPEAPPGRPQTFQPRCLPTSVAHRSAILRSFQLYRWGTHKLRNKAHMQDEMKQVQGLHFSWLATFARAKGEG